MQHLYLKQFYSRLISAVFLIALSLPLNAQKYPVDTIFSNGPKANRINFVYISDGYKQSQLNGFAKDALNINKELFSQSPFVQYKSFFNTYQINVPSAESGAIHPGNAGDEASSNGQPVAIPDNFFKSTFDYGQIHRLLVPQNTSDLNKVIFNSFPESDQGIIVVNSPYYGGSGGIFATASTDPSSTEVAIHELGHSFGGLADEYWAGDIYAGEKPNMTANNNPATIKWKNWLNIDNIGIYEYGSVGTPSQWYKPHQSCKMQFLGFPFCAVCTERLTDRIHELVNMVDNYKPTSTTFALSNKNDVTFSISHLQNQPKTIKVNWYINKATNPMPFVQGKDTVIIPYATFTSGANIVTAEVVDSVGISQSYLPNAGYINSTEWFVTNSVLPVVLKDFRGRVDGKNSGFLEWEVATPGDVQSFVLEKSREGRQFSKIATIQGNNTSFYSYIDAGIFTPYTYYRLVMKDKDGKTNYSNTIRLSPAISSALYKVYQDAQGRNYHLTCSLPANASVVLSITTATGVRILSKTFNKVNNQLDYDFDLHNKAAGVYFANILINGTGHIVKLLAN